MDFPFDQDIETKLLEVVYLYEQAITVFSSLLKEPLLSEFIEDEDSSSKSENENENLISNKAREKLWPNIELLFANDIEYQRIIADLVQYISIEISKVQKYSEVSRCMSLSDL